MSDRPDDPDAPLAPFPTAPPSSPFPPLGETAPELGPPGADESPADPTRDPATAADPAKALIAHPLVSLGRFAFPPGDPPDDEGLAARDRRWTSRVIVIAATVLVIFNVASIQNWTRQQSPGWLTTTVGRLAEVWSEQTALLGADRPRESVRRAYERARDADWPGRAPTQPEP